MKRREMLRASVILQTLRRQLGPRPFQCSKWGAEGIQHSRPS